MQNKRSIILDKPPISYGTCSTLGNMQRLENEVSKLLKDGSLQDHPAGLEGVKIAPIDDLSLLPDSILEVIDRIKGKTADIFHFCVVEISKDIPRHPHDKGVGEVYFAGDGGVNIVTTLGKDHLKNGRFHIVGPGENHGVEKIDDDLSTFVAVKFRKE